MEEMIISTKYDGKRRKLFLQYCTLPECHKPYYAPKHCKRLFCSKECSGLSIRTRTKLFCVLCTKPVEKLICRLKNSRSGLFFCSRSCKDKAQQVNSGTIFDLMRPDHYNNGESVYREIAFRHYLKQCNRCGYNRYEAILQVHHKDRDRTNSTLGNLEIICPNCHMEEHFLSHDGFWSKTLVDDAEIESA